MHAYDFTRIAKALADPRRFGILQAIATRGDAQCGEIFSCANITPATMSHHVRELEQAGLIGTAREGKHLRLTFRPETVRAYVDHLRESFRLPS
ncbi:ArsR family transcriptional regulator [Tanticharoenia sakaeratensis NBRC 103193]|uniref:ArsR family transcriptional regulator n=2 Tax=Tanticharoenia TaxID=444052 RepID=A0A0D6MGZ6_9PROT|nr:ArsR family transcriptional regulator [Tanticharoenia sakaeratensis NBRC 103193]GBQ18179.1 ArsR family transcriptional regulator [Tanticharoenia sakaeratensis NBRC 103193]